MCFTVFVVIPGLTVFVSCIGLFFLLSDVSDMQQFDSEKVGSTLPLATNTTFPESLQGMMWMDQLGHYAHSDIPMGAPDLAFSLANSAIPFDKKTRTVTVDVAGENWQWMDRFDGKLFFKVLKTIGFRYFMQFNEDYTHAQIYPSVFWGKLFVPKELVSFTMVKQTPPAGSCPPAKGAAKAEIAKCAAWDRVSSGLLSPLLGSYGVLHYYVFQIIDGKGKPVQPYYDVFQEWAKISAGGKSFVGISKAQGGKAEL